MNSSLGLTRSDLVVVGQVSIITERLLPEVRRRRMALPPAHGERGRCRGCRGISRERGMRDASRARARVNAHDFKDMHVLHRCPFARQLIARLLIIDFARRLVSRSNFALNHTCDKPPRKISMEKMLQKQNSV